MASQTRLLKEPELAAKREITRIDIMPMDAYAKVREERRQAIREIKKHRRIEIGPFAAMYFENYDTMWWQVHEMLRVERGGEEQIADELRAYNPLIPDGANLKVTFMLEYPDEVERSVHLAKLIDIENKILIQIGELEPVYPIANEDLPRSTEEKTSSVHFLRFEFSQEMISAARNGAAWTIYCLHPNYQHRNNNLPGHVTASLIQDFD